MLADERELAGIDARIASLMQQVDELREVQLANREGMLSYQRATTARLVRLEELAGLNLGAMARIERLEASGIDGDEALRLQAERLIEAISDSARSTLEVMKLLQTKGHDLEARVAKLERQLKAGEGRGDG